MSQVTLISGMERRRVWSDEQKRALIAVACEPGASVADIARRADLRPRQLYRWRRDLAQPVVPGFAALTVSPEPAVPGAAVVLEMLAYRSAASLTPLRKPPIDRLRTLANMHPHHRLGDFTVADQDRLDDCEMLHIAV